jgi:hypothetical protein
MDPVTILGVTASIIACIQLTKTLLNRVGPSSHSKDDLNRILDTINGFQGSYTELQSFLKINEEDEARLSALQHLEKPLQKCNEALEFLRKRLDGLNFIGQHVIGSVWDAKLKKCLERLSEAKDLFDLAMRRDQSYVRTSSYFLTG